MPAPSPATETPTQPSQPPSLDAFAWTQKRLRELGATYYLLETWGPSGGQYRFHCKMPIAGNVDHPRHFEAMDADPARAMQTVLRQVEDWRQAELLGRTPVDETMRR